MSDLDRVLADAAAELEQRAFLDGAREVLGALDPRDPETGAVLDRLLKRVRDGIRALEARGIT